MKWIFKNNYFDVLDSEIRKNNYGDDSFSLGESQ